MTKGLNRHEVFIDIIALPLIDTASWNWTSELRYLVNISSPKWDTPKHMVIENAEGLMELTHDYANRIHGNSTLRKMTDTSGRYYDQFWAPIAKELKGDR